MIGLRTTNTATGGITIDSDSMYYCYLGKVAIPANGGRVYFNCVAQPLLFFNVPHNFGDTTGSNVWGSERNRFGAAILKVVQHAANQWYADIAVTNPGNAAQGLYLRVFGYVHQNYPNGSGVNPALRIRSAGMNRVVWDSGLRMLKLAGNTYNLEMELPAEVPAPGNQPNNLYDRQYNLPFDMTNKSICANSRGTFNYPYETASTYFDGSWIYNYDVVQFNTLYYSTGSQLQARRIGVGFYSTTEYSTLNVSGSARAVYTQLSVIDNAMYP
ncbi:hypothetical protein ACHAC9_22375 [Massilia sp. CMS3.1]|uniref:hypothetical protein n=1 Tax=Massilia sp. CMS3.1 TaxID=3373083 RepID=UPI003EE6638E